MQAIMSTEVLVLLPCEQKMINIH